MLAAPTSAWDRLRGYLPSDHDLFKLAAAIIVLVLCWFLARIVRRLVVREMRRVKADPQVVLLVSRLSFLAAVVIGVVAAFTILFGSPALVFGGFGFLALAFSLAFQDILKNFIAGIFLLLERPFRLGDEISVETHTGTVENIEMRTTTLRTSDGEQVLIPNSLLYTGTITNRTRYPTRLFTLTAKIPAGAKLDGVAERVREQLQNSPEVAKDPPPHVGFQPNIDGGMTLEVRYWLDYRKHDPLAVQAAIGQQVYQAVQRSSGNESGAAAAAAASTTT
ncbi:MAG: mechanosensitive ion channel [Candidatus Dormibacteraeota bacterium]|nr:mechanosensitive ion channel [Candidatus Dormibacteraeota bacterium]